MKGFANESVSADEGRKLRRQLESGLRIAVRSNNKVGVESFFEQSQALKEAWMPQLPTSEKISLTESYRELLGEVLKDAEDQELTEIAATLRGNLAGLKVGLLKPTVQRLQNVESKGSDSPLTPNDYRNSSPVPLNAKSSGQGRA